VGPAGVTAGIVCVAVLCFGGYFLWRLTSLRAAKSIGEQSFVKLAGLTLVVSSGILLIVSGYSQSQIAGMMGLLGTIAGYLLGHERYRESSRANEDTTSTHGKE
jgi:hypothetical protein